MAISIGSNSASTQIQTNLGKTGEALNKSFQRLSSGLRINSASDDPAGLMLADSLRSDARLASVAIRNANDGISLTAIADTALEEVANMLTRMAELATQSANGIYSTSQRSALSSEFLALGSEIERIAKATTFNGLKLLSNSQSVTIQVGLDGSANSRITITSVLATLASINLSPTNSDSLSYSIIATTSTASQLAAQNALSAINAAIGSVNSTRGLIGAAESRLTRAINHLGIIRENYIAAESKIRDADIAQEVANMVRLQILQQAGAAVLAQANQQPAVALALLQ